MDRYSPRRSLYSGPNSFVDSDEVSPEIGLQNAESFYGSAGRSSSRICIQIRDEDLPADPFNIRTHP